MSNRNLLAKLDAIAQAQAQAQDKRAEIRISADPRLCARLGLVPSLFNRTLYGNCATVERGLREVCGKRQGVHLDVSQNVVLGRTSYTYELSEG